jgi:hypothetical protein
VDQGELVTKEQREILRQALDDAVYYRDPPQECLVCEAIDDLCSGCAEGLVLGLRYLETARELRLHD